MLTVDGSDVTRFRRGLGTMPRDLGPHLGRDAREGAEAVAARARAGAGWSSRIPGAIHVVNAGGSAARVVVDSGVAPHARVYENLGGTGSFRHPVFGRDVWVEQGARSFLAPAVDSQEDRVVGNFASSIENVFGRL